jgi:hypothetical protein
MTDNSRGLRPRGVTRGAKNTLCGCFAAPPPRYGPATPRRLGGVAYVDGRLAGVDRHLHLAGGDLAQQARTKALP